MDIPILLQVFLWGALIQVAVYDAREHRIPNKSVLLLIILAFYIKFTTYSDAGFYSILLGDLGAGALFFTAGFVLYLVNAMAPGDVKLLGGVGFLIGWTNSVSGAYFIALAMVVVGSFYYFFFRAQTYHPSLISNVKAFLTRPSCPLSLKTCVYQLHDLGVKRPDKGNTAVNRMPFAPVVVVGLTLYQYYGG